MTNGKSKLQKFIDARSQSGQRPSVAKVLEGMHPDDPFRPIVEAIGEVQADVAEMHSQIITTPASATTSPKQPSEQTDDVWKRLEVLATKTARTVAQKKAEAYANQWLVTASVAMVMCMLAGCMIGYWTSNARSAEARRYWDWNQKLIQECQKQSRKTCNIHVVPPEQW